MHPHLALHHAKTGRRAGCIAVYYADLLQIHQCQDPTERGRVLLKPGINSYDAEALAFGLYMRPSFITDTPAFPVNR